MHNPKNRYRLVVQVARSYCCFEVVYPIQPFCMRISRKSLDMFYIFAAIISIRCQSKNIFKRIFTFSHLLKLMLLKLRGFRAIILQLQQYQQHRWIFAEDRLCIDLANHYMNCPRDNYCIYLQTDLRPVDILDESTLLTLHLSIPFQISQSSLYSIRATFF